MNKVKAIGGVASSVLLFLIGLIMIIDASYGYLLALCVISITFVIKGVKDIAYYFSMARCMVGGQKILASGIIFLDLGLFAFSITRLAKIYVVLYMVLTLMFGGIVYFLKALEEKKNNAPKWQVKMAGALLHLALGIACFFALRNTDVAVIIYGLSLCYSALVKIVNTFRKTEMIYIQ